MQRLALFLCLLAPAQPADVELQSAVDAAMDDDRQASIRKLERALHADGFSAGEASERGVSSLALEARVALVRLYLAESDQAAAEATMDELIHYARERVPPVREYGAKVTQLYERRKHALEGAGRATLSVSCELRCLVVIDGRLEPTRSEELLLGTHQVWIKAVEREVDWAYREIELRDAGQVHVESYDDPEPPALPEPEVAPVLPEPEVAPALPEPEGARERGSRHTPVLPAATPEPAVVAATGSPAQARERRLFPRGAELAGMGVGVGLLALGAVLLSFDRVCSASGEALTPQTTRESCGAVYETTTGGIALLAAGGGLLLVPTVLLSIDEVRVGRAKGRELNVAVRIAF